MLWDLLIENLILDLFLITPEWGDQSKSFPFDASRDSGVEPTGENGATFTSLHSESNGSRYRGFCGVMPNGNFDRGNATNTRPFENANSGLRCEI